MRVVLFIVIIALFFPGAAARASERIIIAQAGSTGGTVGKEGKSVAGGEEPRSLPREKEAQQPAQPNAATLNLPNTILLKESSFAGHILSHCANLVAKFTGELGITATSRNLLLLHSQKTQ
jgi:hypothetical protein